MPYTHTTFGQMKTSLKARLGDTSGIYWVDTEVGLYIVEALRMWGLMTGYWRDTGLFSTAVSTPFYDISTLENGISEDLLSYTVTDTQLSTIIQYHLLEPATGSTWTGSEQFTLADVTDALTRRRDAFLVETGARQTLSTQVLAAGSATVDLSQTVMQARRLDWTGVSGTSWPLVQEDISSQRNYSDSYLLTPGIPQTYSSGSEAPLQYVLAPPSHEPGTIRVIGTASGAALTAAGVVVGIPDDMCWVIKWGALADMLGREGPGQDLTRSYYCERRYRLGVELAKINELVVNAQINGVSLSTEAIDRLDQYSPNWATSTGTPTFVAGYRNYIALAPCPDGVYSVLLDVVRKAVVPTIDGDFVQISADYLNPILDYAEHLAAFKCGGTEFRHTYRAADNFFKAALGYNQRLAAANPAIVDLIKQSTQDDYTQPAQSRTFNRTLEQEAYTVDPSNQRGAA